ncbi:hypothetical protein GSI_00388 [Ganoderma sinense ZZ0214-1]|uniref:Transcription elongation factor Eaf N-terminal domain-containing protein n=1 Tax=Ganoderma sinense ZZ0214-1 TaxID=1077348 RepID=A0A2G8SSF1_9APHY|nr:hypothetical protein GSI_00388 [Ganoderma sinense ZZ0214-1]
MATAADNSWMPSGRHQVHLGASLARTLKARQSAPGPTKSTKPKAEREFYSFRYNFKPESIDVTRSGTIETRRPKEEGGPSTVTVVRPSQQNDTGISFVGTENPAKEFECVLVYDEGTGFITLEKLDSLITLNHDPKPTLAPRLLGSPAPAPPPHASGSSSASSSHAHQSAVKQEEEESEGEIPETKPEPKAEPKVKSRSIAKSVVKSRPQPSTAAAGPPASTPIPASATTSAAATPAPTASTNPRPAPGLPPRPTPPVAAPKQRKAFAASSQTPSIPAKSPNKRERPVEPEEETLEIRRPQPVPKKPKIVKKEPLKQQPPPPPPKPVAFSFPGSSSAVSLPSAPVSAAAPVLAVPDPIAAVSSVVPSDSDDGWEDLVPAVAAPASPVPVPVAAAAPPPTSAGPSHTIFMEEIDEFTPPPREVELPTMAMATDEADAEGDDDIANAMAMAMLEQELEGQLGTVEQDDYFGEGDDFLEAAVSPVEERKPISLSEWAGGDTVFDDDEYSSSDDSDDD